MNAIVKYECDTCGQVYDTSENALYCCPREVNPVYVCGNCQEQYDELSREKAEQCCQEGSE